MGTIKKIINGVVTEVNDDSIVKTIENGVVVEKKLSEVKKKEPEFPLLYGGVKGQLSSDLRSSSDTPSSSEETTTDEIYTPQSLEEYNKRFEDITGHKEFSLSEPIKPKGLLGQSEYEQKKKSFEQKKYEVNRQREKEILSVQNRIETGTVKPEQLADLYEKPYGKKVVTETVNQLVPETGDFGFSKEVFGSEKKWADVAKQINIQNRPKGVEAQNQYFYNLDAELNSDISKLQAANIYSGGGTGGGYAGVNITPLQRVDTNNPEELGQLLTQVENADYISGKEGDKDAVKADLIKKINEKLLYLSSQKELHPEIGMLRDRIAYSVRGAQVDMERGEGLPDVLKRPEDEATQTQFELGLNYIKDVKPAIYANVIRGITEKGKISGADFETLSNIGQQIYNQQVFQRSGADPSLIDAETSIDYTSYDTKKANYARIIGERLKAAGGKNRREFTKEEIQSAARDLPNKEIVSDLANEEQILWYDAIPKSGWREAVVQGVMQPISGIKSTVQAIGESPAETYLRSKKLDTGIGGQLVANEKGEYSAVLPSDRTNIWYDMARGFGQFVPQVLLTKGVGGTLAKAASLEGRLGGLSASQLANIEVYGGTVLSTAAQTYGDAYADALQKTGDPGTAKLIGTIDAISAAGFETILPDVKIADKALGGLRKTLSNDIVDLVKKGGDPATLATKARPFIQKFVTNTLNIAGQEVSEEVGTNIVDFITESIFSPTTAKDRDLGGEIIDTAEGTFISMLLPSILGGGGVAMNKDFTKDGLNTSAINFAESKNSLDKSVLNGAITQDEYDKSMTLLNLHRDSIKEAPLEDRKGERIPAEQRMEYAYQNTLSKIYTENKAATNDKAEQEAIQKKIDASNIEKEKIIGKAEEVKSEYSEMEAKAIEGLIGKDFGPAVKMWTDIIQDKERSSSEKIQALKELHGQLTAKVTETYVGEALGKSADLIYDLGYPVTEESQALQDVQKGVAIPDTIEIGPQEISKPIELDPNLPEGYQPEISKPIELSTKLPIGYVMPETTTAERGINIPKGYKLPEQKATTEQLSNEEIISELEKAAQSKKSNRQKMLAMEETASKYGAIGKKALSINSNFDKIVQKLKDNNKITVKCP